MIFPNRKSNTENRYRGGRGSKNLLMISAEWDRVLAVWSLWGAYRFWGVVNSEQPRASFYHRACAQGEALTPGTAPCLEVKFRQEFLKTQHCALKFPEPTPPWNLPSPTSLVLSLQDNWRQQQCHHCINEQLWRGLALQTKSSRCRPWVMASRKHYSSHFPTKGRWYA